ncbi:MAG: hypothetical protein IJU98_03945 [Synergistaceae bacterium]|nr:hypothetical protein [Synergistaceae bacterium]
MQKLHMAVWSMAALLAFAPASWGDGTYNATGSGEHALELTDGTSKEYSDITVTKTGDASGSSDDYDFKGTNAAILASGGSKLTISGAKITTSATYGNAVFSYGGNSGNSNGGGGNGGGTPPEKPTLAASGDGTTITISDSTIATSKNNSGGIMVTGGGILNATDLTVTTSGGSSAAIRSDRGGGTMTVTGGTFTTSGTGSPAIYSTADITVSGATLKSTTAQGVVVEGGNSVTLNNCAIDANHNKLNGQDTTYNGVMLYQSMSGDASDGSSSFTMTGGSITNAHGDIFHVTNVASTISLTGVSITNRDSDGAFLRATADSWGSSGSNGGKVTLNASGQTLEGDMVVDSISTLDLTLKDNSTFTGAITGGSSASAASSPALASVGTVNVIIEAGSTWNLTGNSTVTSLTNNGTINKNGYTLTTDSSTGDGDTNSDSGNNDSSEDNGSGGDSDKGSGSTSSSSSGCDVGFGIFAVLPFLLLEKTLLCGNRGQRRQ